MTGVVLKQRPVGRRTGEVPKPGELRALRKRLGLTQDEMGELVHSTWHSYSQWERGRRRMHPGLWELLQIKAQRVT